MSSSTGSATGNPRNKVALLPGHSLMDWIRLGNSGADLTSVGGRLQSVTEEDLAHHADHSNAWLVIRGMVYNVAPYLKFHPGGVEELMRGAGKDATSLFTQVHPWVNFESILQKCLVGRLVKKQAATQDDLAKAFFNALPPPSSPSLKMCWSQTTQTICFRVTTGVSSPHVLVRQLPDQRVRLLLRVRKTVHIFSFRPNGELEWPCRLSVSPDSGKVEVQFTKSEEGCWERYGTDDSDHGKVAEDDAELDAYYPAKLHTVIQTTHNVRTMVFKFVDNVAIWVPVGHDVRIRAVISGVDTARRYTPTPPQLPHMTPVSAPSGNNCLSFLIKTYTTGALTPFLSDMKVGDVVDIGGVDGSFDLQTLARTDSLYLIAAGTGITPMIRLIAWGFCNSRSVTAIHILFLNRTEDDVIWKKEFDDLARQEPMLNVMYGLSSPGPNWTGLTGRLDDAMLDKFLPSSPSPFAFICACGPRDFTLTIQEKLVTRGWSSRSHCFLG